MESQDCNKKAKVKSVNELPGDIWDWILYEEMKIYDGWCAAYNIDTGEILLRDSWFMNNLSEKKLEKLLKDIEKSFRKFKKGMK
jgi:hypothetical protein